MNRKITTPGFRSKALLTATAFALLVVALSVYLTWRIEHQREQIIDTQSEISRQAAYEFKRDIGPLLEQVWRQHLGGRQSLTRADEQRADSLLSEKANLILARYDGIEGGIYFRQLDRFIGYAYPSIPSPKPAYGPPPRSYNIIRDQLLHTIEHNEPMLALHGFDPAIFPLATLPIALDGQAEAGIWTRVHISRDLADTGTVTSALITVTLVTALLGFLVALLFSWRMSRDLSHIREGLARIKSDYAYRLPDRPGLPGYISHYINDLMDDFTAAQQRNERLQRDLHQKEKMASLGSTIAGVAHEINTPISIIKTRIQLWERHLARTADQPFSTTIVHEQIERISLLVRRLLSFARPVSERRYPVQIREVIGSAMHLTREKHAERDMVLAMHSEQESFPRINGDFVTLEQLFCNILDNAVQMATATPEIHINCRTEGSHIRIDIIDNGPGIAESQREQVFDPFFTTREQGSGLGLAISKEIVRAHQGDMHFSPRNDHQPGAVCTVTLPVNGEPPAAPWPQSTLNNAPEHTT